MSSSWMNLILKFLTKKDRSYIRRLLSESDKPFCFRARAQGGGGPVSIWATLTAKLVAPLVFYVGRTNGRNYVDVIKHALVTNAP